MDVKKARIGCLLALVILAGLALWTRSCATPPRDAQLVAQFYENRQAFEALKEMMLEDTSFDQIAPWGVARTDESITRPVEETALPDERYRTYLQLLSDAGASNAIRDDHGLRFPGARWGFVDNGWRLAIAYRDTPPTNLIDNIDNFKKTKAEWETACRPNEDGWYLWIIW